MKYQFCVLLVALALCANAFPFGVEEAQETLTEAKNEFSKWKTTFKKVYNDLEEEEHRLSVWLTNLETVVKHNIEYDLGRQTYRMGLNHLSDMNATEVKNRFNGYLHSAKKLRFQPRKAATFMPSLLNTSLPDEVDWRKHGYVTPVKNQGQCGSCWSFSTTGALEGQMKRKTGKLPSLSEQNLVDCSGAEGNMGCNGGLMDDAFEYIKLNGGIDSEESYPYEGVQGKCRYNKTNIAGEDQGFVDIKQGCEHSLKHALATQGPVAVAIDASHRSFQMYDSGVYYEPKCSSDELDHGVLCVGYGEENGHKYWIVKNSWSEDWGEDGYIKMARGKGNMCGIASSASYPLV